MGSHRFEARVLRIRSAARRDSIIEHIREAKADPGFKPRDLLIDARELERTRERLSTKLIRERASEIARYGFRRCAVVPANVPLQRALANYFVFAARAAGLRTRLFLTVEEAEDWLGIPHEGSS